MLRLRKIHILGFKSFCDRTELTLPGTGIAVVVGPNGCGKSNILDGMSWVLGEQSAKTLRGTHMQDVIFSGTRERKALGMAEVTLTLVDREAYEGPVPVEPDVVVEQDSPADWNGTNSAASGKPRLKRSSAPNSRGKDWMRTARTSENS
jgi:chromosome segregation protein